MFNLEAMPPVPAKEEDKQKKEQDIATPAANMETPLIAEEEHPEAEQVPKRAKDVPSNTLWKGMSQEEMMASATGATAERTAEREKKAQEQFAEMLVAQREMIREELQKHGGTMPDSSAGEKVAFPYDKMVAKESGALQWIADKLETTPGGRRLFAAFALVIGLSALPKQAEAGFWGDMGGAAASTAKGVFEGIVRQETARAVLSPQEKMREAEQKKRMEAARQEAAEQQKQQQIRMDELMRQEREKSKVEDARRQAEMQASQAKEMLKYYGESVINEVNNFNRSFKSAATLHKSENPAVAQENRLEVLMDIASNSLLTLKQYDNNYALKYGSKVSELSKDTQQKLENFIKDIKAGKSYLSEKWLDSPLKDVSFTPAN
jgi:hypothetical protein